MELIVDVFSNDKCGLLKILHENQVKVKNSFFVPLSQRKIAGIAHFSKLKTNVFVNRIISGLIDFNCASTYQNKREMCQITNYGLRRLNLML